MDRFLATADADAILRPHFKLPEAATTEGVSINRMSFVRLTSPRSVEISTRGENGNRRLKSGGKAFYCSEAILTVVETLNDGQSHAAQELIDLVPDQAATILNFLQGSILRGTLATLGDTAATSQ
jgi:hypothetical protein